MQYVQAVIDSLNKIEQRYIKLSAVHKVDGLIRERVFCYELYHQMRQNISLNKLTVINGEIDKRGYPEFENKNPDFVFHIPGSRNGNALVCEVKGNIRRPGVKKDFESICHFIEKQNYKSGFFIVFNNSIEQLKQKAGDVIRTFSTRSCADKIWIIAIPKSCCCELEIRLDLF